MDMDDATYIENAKEELCAIECRDSVIYARDCEFAQSCDLIPPTASRDVAMNGITVSRLHDVSTHDHVPRRWFALGCSLRGQR